MGTVVIMIKTQIGLGVLSIPSAFDALGLVPGVICLLTAGGMITWGNYVVGKFKIRHPQVYSIVDVGEMLFGRIGREIFCVLFLLCEFNAFEVGLRKATDDFQGGSVLLLQGFPEYPQRSMLCHYMTHALRLSLLWLQFLVFLLAVFVHWARSRGLPG